MKALTKFDSYREFLKNRFSATKAQNPKRHLGYFAHSIGLSQAALNMILSAKRNLTVESIHACALVLKLSRDEHEYFEALVLRDQSSDATQRNYYQKKMRTLSSEMRVETVQTTNRTLLSDWRVPAILIYLMDFKKIDAEFLDQEDYAKLAARLQLPKTEVERLVKSFIKSGLLKSGENKQIHIEFDKLSAKVAQKNYMTSVNAEFHKRMDRIFDDPDSMYHSFVFSVRKDALQNFRADILEVYQRYMSNVSPDASSNTVVQSAIGLFPII